ncbi:MAG: hypothetical protein ACYC8T_31345, partial [Myxococcaceae bacterium]
MKRFLPALAIALAFAGTGALAGWQVTTVGGAPSDLQIQDAGHVVFTVPTGAIDLVYPADGGAAVNAGIVNVAAAFIGAWHDYGDGRPEALAANGPYRWPTGGYSVSAPNANPFNRLRHSSSGMGYAIAIGNVTGTWDLMCEPSGGVSAASWQALVDPGNLLSANGLVNMNDMVALSAVRVGGTDFALFSDDTQLVLVADAGIAAVFPRSGVTRDLHLFRNGLVPGALVVPRDGGLELVANVTAGGGPTFLPVAVPGGAPDLLSVAFSLEEGSGAGRGFGVAVGSTAGGKAMLRPVPNPADAGVVWVAVAAPAAMAAGNFGRVACYGASFCVATVKAAAANNVAVYWNESAPWILPSTFLVADTASVTATLDAGDDDGDPIYVTWTPAAAYPLTIQPASFDGRKATFTPNPGAFCGTDTTSFTYDLVASDGLASHSTPGVAYVHVVHPPPATPGLSATDAGVTSGGPPVSIVADAGGTCPVTYVWSELIDGGMNVTISGGTLTLFPSPQSCVPGLRHARYQVSAREVTIPSMGAALVDLWESLWVNAAPAPPSVTPAGPVTTTAGGPPVPLRATSSDAGCAPDRLVWTERGDSGYRFWSDGGEAEFTPPAYHCSPDAGRAEYEARAVNSFDASVVIVTFRVEPGNAAPLEPALSAATVTTVSGGPAVTVVATLADAGCVAERLTWTELGASGYQFVPDGGALTFTPPASYCSEDAGSATYQVRAENWYGVSTPDTVTFFVEAQNAAPSPPTVTASGPLVTSGGGGEVTLQALATDAGCDPDRLFWTERGDSGYRFSSDGGWASFKPPDYHCSLDAGVAQYEVRAENWYDASVPVTVTFRVGPGNAAPVPPVVSPAGPQTTKAGGSAVSVTATAGVGGCAPERFVWTFGDSGFSFVADAGYAVFTPPAYLCSPSAVSATYQVSAENSFDASVPVTVTFNVEPWGPPNAPRYAPATLVAGTMGANYPSLDPVHTCTAAPVNLEAELVDAGSAPDGIRPSNIGKLLVVDSSNECVDGTAAIRARHVIGAEASAWGYLDLTVEAHLTSLSDAGFSILEGGYNPLEAKYSGTLSIGANCLSRRGMWGEVAIGREPGVAEVTEPLGSVLSTSPFSIQVRGGCSGGRFFVTARLFEDGGAGPVEAHDAFDAGVQPAKLGEVVEATELRAECGAGASGVVRMDPPVDDPGQPYCRSQSITWEQLDGPALQQPLLEGSEAQLHTVETGFDGLIGREVRLRVSVDAGMGNG